MHAKVINIPDAVQKMSISVNSGQTDPHGVRIIPSSILNVGFSLKEYLGIVGNVLICLFAEH